MVLDRFHPAVRAWFTSRFDAPTPPQEQAWPAIQDGEHTLIAAPTGSGKTLSAFLAAIDDLVRLAERGDLLDETRVLYISPLKALSNDIHKNLEEPLQGISAELAIRGLPDATIRTAVRTGDTPPGERAGMVKRPPHILVTTPESLYILLTSEGGRRMLQTVRQVIVDEIHAVVGSKRGSHLALSLERLDALTGPGVVRVGLSATQKPIEDVARFLTGQGPGPQPPACRIIDTGHRRQLDLALEVPDSPLEAVMSNEVWEEIYTRLTSLIESHATTLVFVNTRRMAERMARHLSERIGAENVTSHHGSLSKEQRLNAETRLKSGSLRALVATASLELGIDIGDVDLVCQIGSPRSIAAFLQRVGRSGHAVGGLPKGRLFPVSRDDLVECTAVLDAVRRGELDRLIIPHAPLDILAQQIVASVAAEEWKEDDLYARIRRAFPYRELTRESFDAVVGMLSNGFSTRKGRRSAYLHRDGVNRKLRPRRGARLTAVTSGGAIPETADYRVVLEPSGTFVGTVNEDFAIESMAGDIFQLGNTSWQILRVESGTVRVADATGQPPTLPFWLGEAPGRTTELSAAVSRLREEISQVLGPLIGDAVQGDPVAHFRTAVNRVSTWLQREIGLSEGAALQLAEYLGAAKGALGVLPTQETVVLERFFDESGGMQLVLHSPFGTRLNRAWGLALRKRFCRSFNFELQAAATDDAIVLSLGLTHSFALSEVFRFLHPETVRDVLVQALLDAPMFEVRWRWNASRALAVPRFQGGKKVPPPLQRMRADDLLSVVFPDQLACLENIAGDREIPDHPLVSETIRDCLTEAMDIDRFVSFIDDVVHDRVQLVALDLREPSPLASEILNARPYAFLDDAPLEERRTQAVMSRRWLDPQTASDLGALDADAVSRVRGEAWPEPRDADELHDALVVFGFITDAEGMRGTLIEDSGAASDWPRLLAELATDRRAGILTLTTGARLWISAERLGELVRVHPDATVDPRLVAPRSDPVTRPEAVTEITRSRLDGLGPVTAAQLTADLGVDRHDIDIALATLESEGYVLQGRFTPGATGTEWCERRLLARIHRYTLNRLRREIEPVNAADFMRFLFSWHGLAPDTRGEGPGALERSLGQLEGFEASAAAWEGDILPSRVADYDPSWLDALCLSGRYVWARRTPPPPPTGSAGGRRPVRATPIALVGRARFPLWSRLTEADLAQPLAGTAGEVDALLGERGASFFHDIVTGSGLLRTQVEDALAELVAAGRVTADGFVGLRALLVPQSKRGGRSDRRRRHLPGFEIEEAGRWSRLGAGAGEGRMDPVDLEEIARTLLLRYGVIFRRLLDREGPLPPWRDLLRVYHRMEARGEIRGGRFVAGLSGEQFALPEAVASLREIRKGTADGALVSICGADPLNLTGLVTPGDRVPALAGNRILYRDGAPAAVRIGGETRMLQSLPAESLWEAKKILERRPVPPKLRAYLGATH